MRLCFFVPSRHPLSTVSKLHTLEGNVLIELSPSNRIYENVVRENEEMPHK